MGNVITLQTIRNEIRATDLSDDSILNQVEYRSDKEVFDINKLEKLIDLSDGWDQGVSSEKIQEMKKEYYLGSDCLTLADFAKEFFAKSAFGEN